MKREVMDGRCGSVVVYLYPVGLGPGFHSRHHKRKEGRDGRGWRLSWMGSVKPGKGL